MSADIIIAISHMDIQFALLYELTNHVNCGYDVQRRLSFVEIELKLAGEQTR